VRPATPRDTPASRAHLCDAGEGRLAVEGTLDFATVGGLLAESEPRFRAGERLAIDLAGVDSANSAGLALLLEWLDLARSRRIELQFFNLPEALQRIAALSNLGTLLPVAPAA
jgi:phospholipid transport system transporter-binding protein